MKIKIYSCRIYNEMISWLLNYYDSSSAPFNYVTGTRVIKQAYKGMNNIQQLIEGCKKEKTQIGLKSNTDIVSLAAPIAFGRTLQVFDLPKMKFPFGRDLHSSFRVPFFFVENKIVKIYFLQPRKSFNLTYDEICMIGTIHKKYLLDTYFFGQNSNIEYIDLCSVGDDNTRAVQKFSLSDLSLWSDKQLLDKLSLISEALEYLKSTNLVSPKKRPEQRIEDMPLF